MRGDMQKNENIEKSKAELIEAKRDLGVNGARCLRFIGDRGRNYTVTLKQLEENILNKLEKGAWESIKQALDDKHRLIREFNMLGAETQVQLTEKGVRMYKLLLETNEG